MNNASSSSSHPQRNDTEQRATPVDNVHGSTTAGEEEENHVPMDEGDRDEPALRKRRIRRAQKLEFFDHLIRNLDMVIYCQISILYYMDISLLALLVRIFFHYVMLTPKPPLPPPFQPFPPSPPPSFFLVSLTNLLPFLMHACTRTPSASEAARGYLHGGILIDFVGQTPVSKLRLVVLDLLVFGLQTVMMTLVLERRGLGPRVGTPAADGHAPSTPPPRGRRMRNQDHDAEERGVLLPSSSTSSASSSPTATEPDERELSSFRAGRRMQGVTQDGDPPANDEDNSGSEDSSPPPAVAAATNEQQHPLDGFRSGQYVVANVHVMSMIRDEWMRHTQEAAASGSGAAAGNRRTALPGATATTTTTTRRRMTVHRGVRRMGRRGRGGDDWGSRLGFSVGSGLAGWR
ncbi:hypothetical protein MMC07_009796 [Pseudocyphellaria aurata]|nr:hypothetical protein [Pseudocyphellaria aurata]